MILTLSEGFVATAVALARRAGIEVEMPAPSSGRTCGGVERDVQVPGNPRAGTADIATALDTRAQELDRWMAR